MRSQHASTQISPHPHRITRFPTALLPEPYSATPGPTIAIASRVGARTRPVHRPGAARWGWQSGHRRRRPWRSWGFGRRASPVARGCRLRRAKTRSGLWLGVFLVWSGCAPVGWPGGVSPPGSHRSVHVRGFRSRWPWRQAVSYCPFVFVEQAIRDRSTLDALVGEVRDGVGRLGWAKVAGAVGSGTGPQPVSGRWTVASVSCGEPVHRVSARISGLECSGGCFLSGKPDVLVAQRVWSPTVECSA